MSDDVDTFDRVKSDEDFKVAPKFNQTKLKRQIRRVEAERKAERNADARLNLSLLGILNSDGSFRKF